MKKNAKEKFPKALDKKKKNAAGKNLLLPPTVFVLVEVLVLRV